MPQMKDMQDDMVAALMTGNCNPWSVKKGRDWYTYHNFDQLKLM